jgi:hypothetical protein
VPYVTEAEVNSFLAADRLAIEDVAADLPGDLEVLVPEAVLSRLDETYDTSGWTDSVDTPDLVRQIIAAKLAAAFYRLKYADQADEWPYADWLDERCESLIMGILDGTVVLRDEDAAVTTAQAHSTILFHPTDDTGTLDTEEDIKFKIGTVF